MTLAANIPLSIVFLMLMLLSEYFLYKTATVEPGILLKRELNNAINANLDRRNQDN